jgi:hypothetical protein
MSIIAAFDSTIPSTPALLVRQAANPQMVEIEIIVDEPLDWAFTELWRGSTNVLGDASFMARSKTRLFYATRSVAGVPMFYWARLVDLSGNLGAFSDSGTLTVSLLPRFKARQANATRSDVTNGLVDMTGATIYYNDGNFLGFNKTLFEIPAGWSGQWHFSTTMSWPNNTTGTYRKVKMFMNGKELAPSISLPPMPGTPPVTAPYTINISFPIAAVAGNVFLIGGADDATPSTLTVDVDFYAHYISP